MNEKFNPKMIVLARESRSMNQKELASKAGMSQGYLSKVEQGLKEISDELIASVSKILEYPKSFFFQEGSIYPIVSFHRKRESLSQRTVGYIEASNNIRRIHITRLLKSYDLEAIQLPHLALADYGSPENIASAIRSYLKLPKGPVDNVTSIIEAFGIPIVESDFTTDRIDGVSIVAMDSPPIIFTNKSIPGDRLRFTLAHELGHLVMHDIPSVDMETEANRFAAEFLMPQKDIRSQLGGLTLLKLVDLKSYWKVSIQALLKRSVTLGRTPERTARYLWMNLSKSGYRVNEPGEIPREEPTLLKEMIHLYKTELGYSDTDLSKIFCLEINEFETLYSNSPKRFRLIVTPQEKAG